MKSLMTRLGPLLLLLVAFVASWPADQAISHVIHEKRDDISSRWVKRSRVEPQTKFRMRIALAQGNLDVAHDALMRVSDPDSEHYGKFWSDEQVNAFFAPSQEAVRAIRQWLQSSGIGNIAHSHNQGWIAFDATSAEAEMLLRTKFYKYEDTVSGAAVPACDEYYVPSHVQRHIDYVKPGVLLAPTLKVEEKQFPKRAVSPRLKPLPKLYEPSLKPSWRPDDLSTCDVAITPACIRALYKIPPQSPFVSRNNSLGIFESELQYWNQVDLDLFFANFTKYIPKGTHPIDIDIDGGVGSTTNLSEAGGEAELDIMLAYPIVYPQTITVFNVDDLVVQANPNDTYTSGFNTFLDALDGSYCNYSAFGETGNLPGVDPTYPDPAPGGYKGSLQCGLYRPTNVISISYGGQEADVPLNYQKRQCNEFLKLGLQGISILFASGDSGVSNYPAPYGIDGPTGCLGPRKDIFNPTWPNTCPYVTNVGATKVYPGKNVFEPESVVFDPAGAPYHVNYSSGGGFSNVYPIPDYQKAAVKSYFEVSNPPYPFYSGFVNDTSKVGYEGASKNGGVYNRIGRGVPDVSANGDNIAIYVGGQFQLSGGTSASTPIFASIINRIVEERLAIGKGPVGFINPALYQNPWVLNDITNGSNPGCGTQGFSAARGWDPASGLGTPNFPKST